MVQQSTSPPSVPIEGADEEPNQPIARSVFSGLKWKAGTQVLGEGSRIVVTLILARLLTPTNYGIAGIAILCASFTSIFVDPALGTALIQRRTITEADRSTVFWVTLAVGVVFMVGGVAASGLVADAFHQPQVRDLFAVLSVTFVLTALGVTQMALLYRKLAYRSLEIREMAATVVGAVVAIALAIAGFGPWAIVMNFVSFTAVSTILMWTVSEWRPRFMFSFDSLRELGGFGVKLFGARILTWGNYNVDNVLVGRFLGAASLGAYSLAYNVMFMPMTRIGIPLTQVLSPAYARMQGDTARLEAAWLTSKRVLVSLLVPCFVACLVVAPDLVVVAFGSKWKAAIVPLQLLCVAGTAHSLVALNQTVLQARHQGGAILRVNIIMSVVTLTAFAAGVPFGIVGVAAAYAIARWLLVPVDIAITSRGASLNFWRVVRTGVDVLPIVAVAAACGFGLREFLIGEGVPAAVRLLAVGASIILVYVALVAVLNRSLLKDAKRLVSGRRNPPAPLAAPVLEGAGEGAS